MKNKADCHILVVDDEVELTDLINDYLTDKGYKITTFNDGYDALNAFKKNPKKFDIVLTDQAMPLMSGDQLIKEISLLSTNTSTLLMTGYNNLISSKTLSDIGANGYINKPIKMQKLAKLVTNYLN